MNNLKPSREVKIAFIFISALFVFVWGFNFMKGSDLLQKTRKFYADYDNVIGLMNANPVLFNGFKIGLVTDMFFAQDKSGKIRVEMTINKDVSIPKNSIARIISSDLLGSKAIQIVPGNHGEAKSGDVIAGEVQLSALEDLGPIKNKAENILNTVDSIVKAVNVVFNYQTQENLINSFESLKQTINHLNSSLSTVDVILSKDKNKLSDIITNIQSISANLKDNNTQITNAIQNISKISDTIAQANLANTLKNVSKSFDELSVTINKINKGEGTLGQMANNDSLYINLQNATNSLDLLIMDMKNNPHRYVHFSLFGRKERKN